MVSILLGPGTRLQQVGAVLRALASRTTVRGSAPPADFSELGDLEELLAPRFGSGRLLLDVDEFLPEDIGFVRRFLKRQPRWQVVLVGVDPNQPAARGLLGDARVSWSRWAPDLEELERFLDPVADTSAPGRNGPGSPRGDASSSGAASLDGQASSELLDGIRRLDVALTSLHHALERDEDPEPAVRAADRVAELLSALVRVSDSDPPQVFDLHRLVEELLAESVLGGAPRYRFRSQGDLHLCAVRSELKESLANLLWISARCWDEGSMVELRADGGADLGHPVHLALDFPAGPLDGLDGRAALSRENLERRLSPEAAERGMRAASSLRTLGARLQVVSGYPGRMRVELALPRTPGDLAPEFPPASPAPASVPGESRDL